MTIPPDSLDRAYFAGLFDGEGCISAKVVAERQYSRATFNVIVGMTDPRPLRLLRREIK